MDTAQNDEHTNVSFSILLVTKFKGQLVPSFGRQLAIHVFAFIWICLYPSDKAN